MQYPKLEPKVRKFEEKYTEKLKEFEKNSNIDEAIGLVEKFLDMMIADLDSNFSEKYQILLYFDSDTKASTISFMDETFLVPDTVSGTDLLKLCCSIFNRLNIFSAYIQYDYKDEIGLFHALYVHVKI